MSLGLRDRGCPRHLIYLERQHVALVVNFRWIPVVNILGGSHGPLCWILIPSFLPCLFAGPCSTTVVSTIHHAMDIYPILPDWDGMQWNTVRKDMKIHINSIYIYSYIQLYHSYIILFSVQSPTLHCMASHKMVACKVKCAEPPVRRESQRPNIWSPGFPQYQQGGWPRDQQNRSSNITSCEHCIHQLGQCQMDWQSQRLKLRLKLRLFHVSRLERMPSRGDVERERSLTERMWSQKWLGRIFQEPRDDLGTTFWYKSSDDNFRPHKCYTPMSLLLFTCFW